MIKISNNVYFYNKKYYFLKNNELINNPYDYIRVINDYFYIVTKDNQYQLINNNFDNFFINNLTFKYISYNKNKFSFYQENSNVSLILPKISKEKFNLFSKILSLNLKYNMTNKLDTLQILVDELTNKLNDITEDNYEKYKNLINNLVKLAFDLDNPLFLKNKIFVICDQDLDNVIDILLENVDFIIDKFSKKALKNNNLNNIDKLYQINYNYFNNYKINLKKELYNKNIDYLFNLLNNMNEDIKNNLNLNREKIYSSIKTIKEYFENENILKYSLTIELKKYLNGNTLLNLIYNKTNNKLLEIINNYDIS